jgi:hypothetical protein
MDQVSKNNSHTQQFRQFLLAAAELHLYNPTWLSDIIPDELPATKVLKLEVEALAGGDFASNVQRLVRCPKWTEPKVYTALLAASDSLSDVLLANCLFLVTIFAGKQFSIIDELLKKLSVVNSDAVFDSLTKELERNPKTCPAALRLLLWMLKQRKHPRHVVLEGIDRQSPSEELNSLLSYFGSDQLVTQFQATFGEGVKDIPKRLSVFFSALNGADQDAFTMILGLLEWSQVVSSLQRVTTESDFHLIQRLIVMFLSRPSGPEVAHSIIVNLVVGDKQSVPRYICLFAGHFPKVVDCMCVADVEVVHAAIERILGLNITKEYEEVFVHILPPMAEFILKAGIPPGIAAGLVLPQKQLLLWLGKKPPWQPPGLLSTTRSHAPPQTPASARVWRSRFGSMSPGCRSSRCRSRRSYLRRGWCSQRRLRTT